MDYTVSPEPFVQLPKIHYLLSYEVFSYNIKAIKTCRGTKKHPKHALPRKTHAKTTTKKPEKKHQRAHL